MQTIVTTTPENTVNVVQEQNSSAITCASALYEPAQSNASRLAVGFPGSPIHTNQMTLDTIDKISAQTVKPWRDYEDAPIDHRIPQGELARIQTYYGTSSPQHLDLSYWGDSSEHGAPDILPDVGLQADLDLASAQSSDDPEVPNPHMPNLVPPNWTGVYAEDDEGIIKAVIEGSPLNTMPGSGQRAYLRNPREESARTQEAWPIEAGDE